MSSAATTPGSAPKSMSSRLLTMKFMQRAAASGSPTTPTPPTPDEPSPKRRKKDFDSPTRPQVNIDELADQRAVQAALEAEEAKRQAALERQAAEAGDTRWVLSFEDQQGVMVTPQQAIRVVQSGYAHLDTPQSASRRTFEEHPEWDEKPAMVGRRSFGKFNKVLEKQQNPSMEDSSDSNSDSEEDEDEDSDDSSSDDDDPTSELIKDSRQEAAERAKANRKSQKVAEKAQSAELARQRKKKELNLNGEASLRGLTSLSGRQDRQSGSTVSCYQCGGPHLIKECPKRPYQGDQGGFAKKPRIQR